jgi:hypothetical protein
MHRTVKAVYRGGAFVPNEACDLPENAGFEFQIREPSIIAPAVRDAAMRSGF